MFARNLSLVSLVFSLFALMTSFSYSEYGHAYYVYDYEKVSNEYKMAQKNNAPEDVLKHIFNRKEKIKGIKSLYISAFSIDGYLPYSNDYELFTNSIEAKH